jgi:tetratricopeptide (TPR) repeat protein
VIKLLSPRIVLSLVLVLIASTLTLSQQKPSASSPEDVAFQAVNSATNPAARLAAAEDFVANFPKSSRRPEIARLVSEQLPVLRNPQVALVLVDRARAIFTTSEELEFLQPVALEIYADANRADEAFALAADFLARKPDELWALVKMTYLGAREAKERRLKYADTSLTYGLKAIDMIEKDQRQPGIKDSTWVDLKSKLPGLHIQIGLIKLAQGLAAEAKTRITTAIQLRPNDPVALALLGRVLNSEYEKQMIDYQKMEEGSAKQNEKRRLDTLLDEVIDAYARAVALASGKEQHQTMLQQVVPDLTSYYKYRNNGSMAGLQKLIDKYKVR